MKVIAFPIVVFILVWGAAAAVAKPYVRVACHCDQWTEVQRHWDYKGHVFGLGATANEAVDDAYYRCATPVIADLGRVLRAQVRGCVEVK